MGITAAACIAFLCVGGHEGASAVPLPPDAARGGFRAREGFYLAVHGAWAQLDRDFDGDVLLSSTAETIAVPDADDGAGLGIAVGHRWERNALELDVTVTEHDGTLPAGASGGDVTYGALDASWRYFFRPDRHLQPFFQATLGVAVATLEDAAIDTTSLEVDDAELAGVEFGLGGGVEYFLTERWSLGLRALYRQTYFDMAEGVSDDESDIDHSVEARGWVLSIGTAFTF
jgi:opacity protein-like surface antigen